MGIFNRTRDIINSNINAALDKAENPEKLIRQMVHEMEETLIEIKSACAGTMAGKRKLQRIEAHANERAARWDERARRAVERGRDDLARQALWEKRRYSEDADSAAADAANLEQLEADYRDDIVKLEEKLASVRERQRLLVRRHKHVQHHKRVEREIRKLDSSEAFVRFEELEFRLDRNEAEAELVNFGVAETPRTLDEEFAHMERNTEIEAELKALKTKSQPPRVVHA